MNPYLQNQANAITQQANRNLQNNVLPGINSGAMQAGGFGGSRHGIAQGLAIGQTQQSLTNSLAGLYGNAYEQDQNRAQQRYGMDQQFQLGQGNLALGNKQADNSFSLGQGNLALGQTQAANQFALGQGQNANQAQVNANQFALGQGQNQNQANSIANQYNLGLGNLGLGQTQAQNNFFSTQRGQDLQQAQLGMQMANMGNAGLAGQGQQLWQAGQQQQQAPWWAMQQFANTLGPFSGMGGSTTQSTPGPGAVNGALAGGLTAAQLWQMLMGGK